MVVDESLVSAVKATEVYRAMPTAQPERPRDKPSKEWRRSSLGRYHRREEAMCESDVNVLCCMRGHYSAAPVSSMSAFRLMAVRSSSPHRTKRTRSAAEDA